MKTLYIVSRGLNKPDYEEIRRREQQFLQPNETMLDDAISATLLDERYLQNNTGKWRSRFYALLPLPVSQVIETLFIHRAYDVIFTQTEKAGLLLGLIKSLIPLRTPLMMAISRITSGDIKKSRRKQWMFRRSQKGVDRYVIWSSVQRRLAIDELGFPASKITLVKRGTDERFWQGTPAETDMICAAGAEMRDYPTLIEALRPLNIRCHIAAGPKRGELFDTVSCIDREQLPDHIEMEHKDLAELKALYNRSRFVVVPLQPTDSDNGLTSILEAMAMGKPVIYSAVEGQVDVVEDGVTGISVPQGDPAALREAIESLWNDPERAHRMGRQARQYIEEHHRSKDFAETIRSELYQAAAIAENRATARSASTHLARPRQ